MVIHSISISYCPHSDKVDTKFSESITHSDPITSGYYCSSDCTFIKYNYERETSKDLDYEIYTDVEIIQILFSRFSNYIDSKMSSLKTYRANVANSLKKLKVNAIKNEFYCPEAGEIVLAKKNVNDQFKYVRFIRKMTANGKTFNVCTEFENTKEDYYQYIRKISNEVNDI